MGECLITRRGGESYELPVLNASYPQDASVVESASGSATFYVTIDTPGKPAEYTYQWYVDGKAVSGATDAAYTKTGLTATATYKVHCEVTNKAGTIQSRIATLTVQSSQPTYTYSGSHELIKENTYDWKLKLKTSGKLKFSHLGNCTSLDVFCVGGGGGGGGWDGSNGQSGAGGGGGYTKDERSKSVAVGTEYTITVGSGGSSEVEGGSTSAFGVTANGGKVSLKHHTGGDGGSGGGPVGYAGGSNGSNSKSKTSANRNPGKGQGSTTKEFGTGTLYSGGGGGGFYGGGSTNWAAGGDGGGGSGDNGNGGTNTGGGGGGMKGKGGSGIVVIRNHR